MTKMAGNYSNENLLLSPTDHLVHRETLQGFVLLCCPYHHAALLQPGAVSLSLSLVTTVECPLVN